MLRKRRALSTLAHHSTPIISLLSFAGNQFDSSTFSVLMAGIAALKAAIVLLLPEEPEVVT